VIQDFLKQLYPYEEGQDLLEYALFLVLIALAAAATVQALERAVKGASVNVRIALAEYTD
jgi:Flp pilus assembly pilin Flp